MESRKRLRSGTAAFRANEGLSPHVANDGSLWIGSGASLGMSSNRAHRARVRVASSAHIRTRSKRIDSRCDRSTVAAIHDRPACCFRQTARRARMLEETGNEAILDERVRSTSF